MESSNDGAGISGDDSGCSARFEVLHDLALLLESGDPLPALFQRLPGLLHAAIAFDYLGLAFQDGSGEGSRVFEWSTDGIERPQGRLMASELVDPAALAERSGPVFQFRPAESTVATASSFAAEGYQRSAVVVLYRQHTPVGVLHVSRRDDREFSPDDIAFLRVAATLLAQAGVQSLRVERSNLEAEEQRILAEASAIAAREPDRSRLVAQLARSLGRRVPQPVIGFGVIDGDSVVYDDESGTQPRLRIGRILRAAIERGQVAGEAVVEGKLRPIGDHLIALGVHAWSVTAARSAGQVVGLLMVTSRRPGHRFTPGDLSLFSEVAAAVGPALANALAADRARRDAEEQRILAGAAAVAAREREPLAIVGALSGALDALIPGVTVDFGFLDGEFMSFHSLRHETWRFPCGRYARQAIAEGQCVIEGCPPDMQPHTVDLIREDRVARHVITAARSGGVVIGLLITGTSDADHQFSDRDLVLLKRVAEIVGPAMANRLAAQQSVEEAAEQRIIAAVAGAAAAESAPGALVAAVLKPLYGMMPKPFLAYGYIEDGYISYPRPDGDVVRVPVDHYMRAAEEQGQQSGDEIPEDLRPDALLPGFGVHAVAVTAARAGGVTVGFLLTGSRQKAYRFSVRDLRIFRLIAQILGPAMETARAVQRSREEAAEQRLLAQVAAAAAREPDEVELLRALRAHLSEPIPGLVVGYAFIDGDSVRHVAKHGDFRVSITAAERRVLAEGQVLLDGLPADLPPGFPAFAEDVRALAITGTYSAARPTGFLYVGSRDPAVSFGERELRVFRLLAQIVGPAMEAIRQDALYRLMVSSLSEAVLVFDQDLRTVFANEPGRKLAAIVGFANSVWTTDQPSPAQSVRDALGGHRRSQGRVELPTPDGVSWYDYELLPLDARGSRLLVIASDITEAVLREREEKVQREGMYQASRLAALGELISGVAHELNNPLTAILGFAELLALAPPGQEMSDELEVIRKEALRARNIVRDLLLIARPGQVELAPVNLREVVGHIERLRRNSWLTSGISVGIDLPEDASEVLGNENQLTQVLLNLVTNAEHALASQPRRAITIRARAEGSTIVLEVADTGHGMDEATAARVFEPFFTTKQGQGTGLGLSLSYSIIRSHNGAIAVRSRPGRGTTFTVTLPAQERPAQPIPLPNPDVLVAPLNVLVVDDEPSLRRVCRRLLTTMGYGCSTAETVGEALDLVAASHFDLVICDYRLGPQTADAFVEVVSRRDPALLRRIAIATGATTDPGVLELTGRHSLPLLSKPYGRDEVARLVSDLAQNPAA